LARLWQRPKGAMLSNGILSMIVAAGRPPTMTRRSGRTLRALGVSPKLHWSMAPAQTLNGTTPRYRRRAGTAGQLSTPYC
jgi:hypothetical protein